MSDLKQKESPGEALFTLFNHLNPLAREEFIIRFAHDVFHAKVLIRPDKTVLIPNEETKKVLEEPISDKIKCTSLDELFEKLNEED
jgi:hypothetical protein